MKTKDIGLILIIGAAALLFVLLRWLPGQTVGQPAVQGRVSVYIGSSREPYETAPIGSEATITVDQGDGRVNVIEVTPEGVRMASSTCDNQDCLQQGQITPENRTTRLLNDWIICLPNQVSVEFAVEEAS